MGDGFWVGFGLGADADVWVEKCKRDFEEKVERERREREERAKEREGEEKKSVRWAV
jgi:hypothetical protein